MTKIGIGILDVLLRGPAWACRQFLRLLGVSYEIRGTENIRKESGGVVLINHQSFIDLAGILYVLCSFFFKLESIQMFVCFTLPIL